MSVIMPTIKSIRAMLAGGHQDRTSGTEAAGRHADHSDCVVSLHDHQAKVREQTRRDEARFWLAAIADSSDDAIVGTNLGGVVTSWNKAAEATYGYAANEIIGQMVDCIIPSNRIDEEPSILKRIRRGEKIVHFETKRQRKDGTVIPVSLTVSAIRDDQGKIIGAFKITRDLTETQRTQREQGRRAYGAGRGQGGAHGGPLTGRNPGHDPFGG